jgi:hypothetical protein
MPGPHQQIPLGQARPGMTLSDDLLDSSGNALLTRGAVLTTTTLAALARHQVDSVPIVCTGNSDSDPVAARAHLEQRLAILFRKPGNAGEDATGILQHYVRHFRLKPEDTP